MLQLKHPAVLQLHVHQSVNQPAVLRLVPQLVPRPVPPAVLPAAVLLAAVPQLVLLPAALATN